MISRFTIFDIEANGLLEEATRVHCLSYQILEKGKILCKGTFTKTEEIKTFIEQQHILVGHNIVRYDIPLLEKLIPGINITARIIDTLSISWYQYPEKSIIAKHGLEYWGEKLGFGKPIVEDWENQPLDVYIQRCEADTEINTRLFIQQHKYTLDIYGSEEEVFRIYGYLTFKMKCLRDQETEGIKINEPLVRKSKKELEDLLEEKMNALRPEMPPIQGKHKPKVMYLKNGELSSNGKKWIETLKKLNLPLDTEYLTEYGNPGSSSQLKSWLLSLGWKPEIFKTSKNTGKDIPQLSEAGSSDLCDSVKDMFEKYPYLENLDQLFIIKHRLGIFKSFLDCVDKDGKIQSTAHGFTNTLRLKHKKPTANMPAINTFYGEQIRGALTVPDDSYLMCGSDISGLEDNTKQHYLYFFDPEYVRQIRVPGFDPHMDIALLAEMVTEDDFKFYKHFADLVHTPEDIARYHFIKDVRGKAKRVNFSATYGAGPVKIASVLKCSVAFATKLHDTYWERNKAIKQVAEACTVKTVHFEGFTSYDQKWLYNPLSGFWMFLKAEKDRFSTLNQSSGDYVFNTWLRKVKQKIKPFDAHVVLQYHDELLLICKESQRAQMSKILIDSMKETNIEIKLNVEIKISLDWGKNYADCH